ALPPGGLLGSLVQRLVNRDLRAYHVIILPLGDNTRKCPRATAGAPKIPPTTSPRASGTGMARPRPTGPTRSEVALDDVHHTRAEKRDGDRRQKERHDLPERSRRAIRHRALEPLGVVEKQPDH